MSGMFHLEAKVVSRADGRSTTAAVAYRAGEKIVDERTGEIHNYKPKRGVLHSQLILPGGGTASRSEFWNRVEKHHKRGDAVLAREFIAALPTELTMAARQALAVGFAGELAEKYGVAADVALHEPRTVTNRDLKKNPDQYHEIDPQTGRRHNGNWHSHTVLSACHVFPDGALGKKSVEMDPIHCQRAKIENMVEWSRRRWADLVNAALEQAGESVRVDHRTLEAQGITDRLPSAHLGPAGSGMKRRGKESEIEIRENAKTRQFIADMEAAATAQAQDDAEIAAIEAQLQLAQAERVRQQLEAQEAAAQAERDERERLEADEGAVVTAPVIVAPRTRQVVAAELAPLLATIKRSAEIEAVGSQRIKSARPKTEIEAAKKTAPGVQNRALSARQRAAALTAELEKMPFWRFVRRFQVRQELPKVERLAKALTQEAEALLSLAGADAVEHVAAVLFESREALREALAKSKPLQGELQALEAREAAQKAQAAETAAQLKQAQRLQHAARIQAALHQHRESQGQDLDRDQERDRGQGMSM